MVSVKKSAVGSPRDSRRGPNTPRLREIAQISGNRTGRKVVIEITTGFRYSLINSGHWALWNFGSWDSNKAHPIAQRFLLFRNIHIYIYISIYIYICIYIYGIWGLGFLGIMVFFGLGSRSLKYVLLLTGWELHMFICLFAGSPRP